MFSYCSCCVFQVWRRRSLRGGVRTCLPHQVPWCPRHTPGLCAHVGAVSRRTFCSLCGRAPVRLLQPHQVSHSGVASPTLFFLKIASAILGPWHFHVNCGILHQARWRLDWDGVESRVCGSVGRAPLPLISAHLLDSMFVLFHGPPPPIFSATSGSISWKFLSPPGLVKVMHTN